MIFTDENQVKIDDELNDYIEENLAPYSRFLIKQAIALMDYFQYGDYALDLYNFVNLNHVNISQTEANLLFINLTLSHVVKLIEQLGLQIEDDELINDDYSNYLQTLVYILKGFYFIKDMTPVDAVYFADIINNDYFSKEEILYRIFQYYIPELKEDEFYTIVKDITPSLWNILITKTTDLSTKVDMEQPNDGEINENLLLAKYTLANYLKSITDNQLTDFINLILIVEDIGNLVHNKEFLINRKLQYELNLKTFLNTVTYYEELRDNPKLKYHIFDLLFINLLYLIFIEDLTIEEAITETETDLSEFYNNNDLPGIRVLKQTTKEILNQLAELFNDNDFKSTFNQVFKIDLEG